MRWLPQKKLFWLCKNKNAIYSKTLTVEVYRASVVIGLCDASVFVKVFYLVLYHFFFFSHVTTFVGECQMYIFKID